LLDKLISQLDRQSEVEIENTGLAYILNLGTCLTDFSFLVASRFSRILSARLPPEHSEGSLARLAFSGELRPSHPDIRIIAEAGLAEHREV